MNINQYMHKTILAIALFMIFSTTALAIPTAKETRAIAKEAYIFSYPLVMNYRTMYMQAIKGDGAFGKWLHLGLASPEDTDIVTPNNDTPYSYAWLDLRAEPWVLTMPSIEKERFYTSQWDDLWGYVLDNAGSVNDGNDLEHYLLVSPTWKGKRPKGITRIIRGESDFLGSLTRTQLMGGHKDMARVKDIQQSYKLQPLSSFIGTKAPLAAAPIDWPEWREGDEANERYFSYVNFMLSFIHPHADDQKMYDKMASIGLKAGASWDPKTLDPNFRKAFQQGLEDARLELKHRSEAKFDPARFFNSRELLGTDYINRALGVYVGIFGNTTDQSIYLTKVNDVNGNKTDASKHDYSITFAAGAYPPVKYFWSFTMYSLPQRWLVDNPINRYSIGSSTENMQKNPDGSLTIYISHKSPGKARESNWLPAPNGPFWIVLRTYGPSQAILHKEWQQPNYKVQ